MTDRLLAQTPYLRFIDRDGWAFVERPNGGSVVAIVALTDDHKIVLVEQFRIPLGREVVELPAGLVGDEAVGEAAIAAAVRELREETGYEAARMELLVTCPTSVGTTSEMVTLFLATGLKKVAAGGGVGDENIRVCEIPLRQLHEWLRGREAAGLLVAAKLYAGLFFIADRVPWAGRPPAAATGTER